MIKKNPLVIQNWELVYLSKLIKKKTKMLGNLEKDKNEKKNLLTIRRFIDTICEGNIDNVIKKFEEQTKGGEEIEKFNSD